VVLPRTDTPLPPRHSFMDISNGARANPPCTGCRRSLFVSSIRGPRALFVCGLVVFTMVVVEVVVGGALLFFHSYVYLSLGLCPYT
jgi:hypothetical protein